MLNLTPSRLNPLMYDPNLKNLKRARTYDGSLITEHLTYCATGSSQANLQSTKSNSIIHFDENYGLELGTLSKQQSGRISPPNSLKQSGLHPRYNNKQSKFNAFPIPPKLDPGSSSPLNPYSTVTFKIEENLKTIVESSSELLKKKYHVHDFNTTVDSKAQPIKLLSYDAKLDLSSLKGNIVSKAAPFFETLEFNPYYTDEIGILLKILNHEFETCFREEEKEERMANDCNEEVPDEIPWYRNLSNAAVKAFDDFIKSWQPISKDEYNKKYPWDKFYDPELYYEFKIDEIHEVNLDMIATDDLGSISKSNSMYMRKPHNYLFKRKLFK